MTERAAGGETSLTRKDKGAIVCLYAGELTTMLLMISCGVRKLGQSKEKQVVVVVVVFGAASSPSDHTWSRIDNKEPDKNWIGPQLCS